MWTQPKYQTTQISEWSVIKINSYREHYNNNPGHHLIVKPNISFCLLNHLGENDEFVILHPLWIANFPSKASFHKKLFFVLFFFQCMIIIIRHAHARAAHAPQPSSACIVYHFQTPILANLSAWFAARVSIPHLLGL